MLIVAGPVLRDTCNVGRADLADVCVVAFVELRGLDDVAATVLLTIQIVHLVDSILNGCDVVFVPGCLCFKRVANPGLREAGGITISDLRLQSIAPSYPGCARVDPKTKGRANARPVKCFVR